MSGYDPSPLPPYQGAGGAYFQDPAQNPGGQHYPSAPISNTLGPAQYPGGPPYHGPPNPYPPGPPQYPGGQPYGGGGGGAGSIVVVQQQQQQQQQQQTVVVQRSGVNHVLCAIICCFTGGLSIPCWIIACLAE